MGFIDESGCITEEMLTFINTTKDNIFIKNRDFVYIAASDNYILNCAQCNSLEDVIGKTDFEIFEAQEMAVRYRANDQEMFASKKGVAEFQEEYPNRSGKKHFCVTTKYLLYDDSGNPAAIFGQFHDIGEQVEEEIRRRRNLDQKSLEALGHSFFAITQANLREHTFQIVRATDYSRKMLEPCENVEQAFDAFIHTLVQSEFRKKMYAMIMNSSIDAAKKAELDREEATRKAMRLQLRVGELISRTSIVQTAVIDKNTGMTDVWLDAVFTSQSISRSFHDMKTFGRKLVYPQDAIYYDTFFTLPGIMKELEEKDTYELSHRILDTDGNVKTIVHHFEALRRDKSKILMVVEDVSDAVPQGIEWMSQFEILESVAEHIAIFDYETYDVVYMNKLAREQVGMDLETLRTKKCYELFGDGDKPCPFCDKFMLDNGNNAFTCRDIKGLGAELLYPWVYFDDQWKEVSCGAGGSDI